MCRIFFSISNKYFILPPTPTDTIHTSTFLIIDVFLFNSHPMTKFSIRGWWQKERREIPNGSKNKQALNEKLSLQNTPLSFRAAHFHQTTNNFRKCLVEHTNTMIPFSNLHRQQPAKAKSEENFYSFFYAKEKWVRMVNWWYGNERI